ncbi:hypothetical protein ACQPZX_18335 [Actinoplanes sp. CA-142083]|uniref:hypothetical protein n=1 Tax=Actinoplanes sp. CA-142083 TaxID=3239903 RepID=UPI003D8C344E
MSDIRNVRLSAAPANLEYARRVYDRVIDWYKVAETKAQLILTVNGAFVTIAFGILTGSIADLRDSLDEWGALTWLFLTLTVVTISASIVCAALSLLSQHERHIRQDFKQLKIDPDREKTYRPEGAWYYGHIAKLRWEGVQSMLAGADEKFEVDVLTYHVHGLSQTVLRKHRLINAGWMLTAATLLSLVGAGASLLLHR